MTTVERPDQWNTLGDHDQRIRKLEANPGGPSPGAVWTDFVEPFNNGWSATGGAYLAPAWTVENNVPYTRGSITGGTSGTSPFSVPGAPFDGTTVSAAALTDGSGLAITVVDGTTGLVTVYTLGASDITVATETNLTGILEGTGTNIGVATEGTDYYKPGGTDVAIGDGGTGASTAGGARTNLSLVPGTDIQAFDPDLLTIAGLVPAADDVLQQKAGAWTNRTMAQLIADLAAVGTTFQPKDTELTALAGLTSAADKLPYFTGSGTASVTDLTSAARTVLDDTTVGAMLTTLGGQPVDSDLTAIAALTPTNDDVIQRKAGAWTNRTLAQLIADLAALGTTFQALDATLTALAGANWAANALPIGSGADALSQVAFAANTFPARASTGNLVAKTITDYGLSLAAAANAAAIDVTYSTYTPTWTSSGTAPAIGDASVTARYTQIGKLVHAYGAISFGASSTFGTGNYRFALPVTCSGNALNAQILGIAFLFDSSTTNWVSVIPAALTSDTLQFLYGATYLGALRGVGQTTPWTWAQSYSINWHITYEAA